MRGPARDQIANGTGQRRVRAYSRAVAWMKVLLPLGALAVFLLFRWPERIRDPVVRSLLVGQLTTAYGIFNLSFGAWQTWWLVALVLAAFVAAVVVEGVQATDAFGEG